ncbi:hypothetical protein Tco_1450641 [Tanacetum coccineum]
MMTGPVIGGYEDDRGGTPPLTKEQIEGHISALRSQIKDHNKENTVDPIQLNFELEDTEVGSSEIAKGKTVGDADLKEALRTPLTRRIIEFARPKYKIPTNIKLYDSTTDLEDHLNRFASAANFGEWPMPVWCRMFQQTLDGSTRRWFERLPANSINEWSKLREAFSVRLDDFVLSEKSFARTELPKGEACEHPRRSFLLVTRRDDRPYRNNHGGEARRNDNQNNHRGRDNYGLYRGKDNRAPYPPPRGDYQGRVVPVLTLDALIKPPKKFSY